MWKIILYKIKSRVVRALDSALWHIHIIFSKSASFDEKKGIRILNEYFLMSDLTNSAKLCSCVNILKMF